MAWYDIKINMYVLVVSNDSYRDKTKVELESIMIKEHIEKNLCMTRKKLGSRGWCTRVSQIFSILFFMIECSMVLTLDYNKRCCVDLALLFCNDPQEMDWKAV